MSAQIHRLNSTWFFNTVLQLSKKWSLLHSLFNYTLHRQVNRNGKPRCGLWIASKHGSFDHRSPSASNRNACNKCANATFSSRIANFWPTMATISFCLPLLMHYECALKYWGEKSHELFISGICFGVYYVAINWSIFLSLPMQFRGPALKGM
jgi:hypothetical protein